MSAEVYHAALILSSSGFTNDTTRASDRINQKMREYRWVMTKEVITVGPTTVSP